MARKAIGPKLSISAWRRALVLIALARENKPTSVARLGVILDDDHTSLHAALRQLEDNWLVDRSERRVEVRWSERAKAGRYGYQANPLARTILERAPPPVHW